MKNLFSNLTRFALNGRPYGLFEGPYEGTSLVLVDLISTTMLAQFQWGGTTPLHGHSCIVKRERVTGTDAPVIESSELVCLVGTQEWSYFDSTNRTQHRLGTHATAMGAILALCELIAGAKL